MSKNLSQPPKTAAIVEEITIVRAQKTKTTVKNSVPKIARSPERKSNSAPYYRYRSTHHNGKARQHTSFSTKPRIYQTLKMAFNHPFMLQTRPIVLPFQPQTRGTQAPNQSLSHISQQHLVPPLRCIGFTGCAYQYLFHTTFLEQTIPLTRKFHPRRK